MFQDRKQVTSSNSIVNLLVTDPLARELMVFPSRRVNVFGMFLLGSLRSVVNIHGSYTFMGHKCGENVILTTVAMCV
jgi:hypothetical protein